MTKSGGKDMELILSYAVILPQYKRIKGAGNRKYNWLGLPETALHFPLGET